MSYYIRLLSPSRTPVGIEALRAALAGLGAGDLVLIPEDEGEDGAAAPAWEALIAYTAEGDPIGLLTRDVVTGRAEDLAGDEIAEFKEELEEALPKSGAAWVKAYLSRVETIYALQIMAAGLDERAAGAPGLILSALQEAAGGIIQADGEGFSNEEGDHVVWQFDDDADGPRTAAVLTGKTWTAFRMDLADPAHRAAFLAGQTPPGAEIVPS